MREPVDFCPESPLDTRGGATKISPPPSAAGGAAAVLSTLSHSNAEMGLARTVSTLSRLNQFKGFDCPGCAWPDPDDRRSMVEFCENGAKAVADEATRARIDHTFFEKYSIQVLSEHSDHWLGKRGRITEPLLLDKDQNHYRPISWERAISLIADECESLDDPNEAAFYTSGRTSNEAAFLYQLFVRLLGTNNLPDCSNMCHESSGVGLKEAIGVGKGTVTLKDFESADLIVVMGQNPGTNHPRMLTMLQAASRRGARIASINPLPEVGTERFRNPQEVGGWIGPSTKLSTLHIPVKVNGDVALLQGVAKLMTGLDDDFIDRHTVGFSEYKASLESVAWPEIEESSGCSRAEIEELALLLSKSERTIVCWAMGLTQHENAVANIQEVVNILLLKGQLGKPGAGVCPVRGHSNVQG